MKTQRVDTWAAAIKDKPGALAAKFKALSAAGVNLEFVIARRSPEKRGAGVVFVTPIKGPKQCGAARAAGFKKTKSLHTVRIEGLNKRGQRHASHASAGRQRPQLARAVCGSHRKQIHLPHRHGQRGRCQQGRTHSEQAVTTGLQSPNHDQVVEELKQVVFTPANELLRLTIRSRVVKRN